VSWHHSGGAYTSIYAHAQVTGTLRCVLCVCVRARKSVSGWVGGVHNDSRHPRIRVVVLVAERSLAPRRLQLGMLTIKIVRVLMPAIVDHVRNVRVSVLQCALVGVGTGEGAAGQAQKKRKCERSSVRVVITGQGLLKMKMVALCCRGCGSSALCRQGSAAAATAEALVYSNNNKG